MLKFLGGFVCALALLGVAAVAYAYSGQFDVAASSPHGTVTRWMLNTAMTRSVIVSAGAVGGEAAIPPALGSQDIEEGFEHYDEMCTTCHGGPGIERSEIGKGLNPRAPDLAKAIKAWTPRQLFWIVKHGVKMTGMPSFGVTHNDEQIWSIVAFVEKLPEMSPERYQQMRQQPSRPHSHEDLMDMKH